MPLVAWHCQANLGNWWTPDFLTQPLEYREWLWMGGWAPVESMTEAPFWLLCQVKIMSKLYHPSRQLRPSSAWIYHANSTRAISFSCPYFHCPRPQIWSDKLPILLSPPVLASRPPLFVMRGGRTRDNPEFSNNSVSVWKPIYFMVSPPLRWNQGCLFPSHTNRIQQKYSH